MERIWRRQRQKERGRKGGKEPKREGRKKRIKEEKIEILKLIITVFCSDFQSVVHRPLRVSKILSGGLQSQSFVNSSSEEGRRGGGRGRGLNREEKEKLFRCVDICTEQCKRSGAENCCCLSTKRRQCH